MTEQAKAKRKIFDFSLLRRVFHFAAPYKNKFYASLVLAIVLAVIAPVRPLLIQLTINDGIKGNMSSHFINGPGGFIIEISNQGIRFGVRFQVACHNAWCCVCSHISKRC